jgi:hypothetical protein
MATLTSLSLSLLRRATGEPRAEEDEYARDRHVEQVVRDRLYANPSRPPLIEVTRGSQPLTSRRS